MTYTESRNAVTVYRDGAPRSARQITRDFAASLIGPNYVEWAERQLDKYRWNSAIRIPVKRRVIGEGE